MTGLTHSDQPAAAIEAAGASVRHGDLGDLETLRKAASDTDRVIHLAFEAVRSTDFMEAVASNLRAIEAFGEALEGSGKPLAATSATLPFSFIGGITDRLATEDDAMEGGTRVDAESLYAARLYRPALESAAAGSRLHAVADRGIPFREIAAAIAARLQIPTASIGSRRPRGAFLPPRTVRRHGQPGIERPDTHHTGLAAPKHRLIDDLDHYLQG